MCSNGFHCCSEPLDCLRHYDMPLRLCEVLVGCENISDATKTVTSQITIVREIVGDEFKKVLTGNTSNDKWPGSRWYVEGNLHREEDLPARISPNGSQYWYCNGKLHRVGNMPAVISFDGIKEWWFEGKIQKISYSV